MSLPSDLATLFSSSSSNGHLLRLQSDPRKSDESIPEIRSITEEIDKLSTYSQTQRAAEHENILARIEILQLLYVDPSVIGELKKSLEHKYQSLISDGYGASSSY